MKIQKNITFSVPIKKVLDKDKNDHNKNKKNGKDKKAKIITYKLRFIDSSRFMQDSLSILVNNLSGINNKVSESDKKISQETLIKFVF